LASIVEQGDRDLDSLEGTNLAKRSRRTGKQRLYFYEMTRGRYR
jgi:hypothetical protein